MAKIIIQNDSGDREFFTIVPNYILNHSTANDQSLYLQMKRYAGEDGKCFATQETLMKKMGIGRISFNKSLKYLVNHKWIDFIGITEGKTRPIKTYKVNNIWQKNSDYYRENKEIPSRTAVSFNQEIPSETTGDTVQNSSKIPSRTAVEEDPQIRRSKEEDKEREREVAIATRTPEEEIINFLSKGESYQKTLTWLIAKNIPEIVAKKELQKFIDYWTEPNKSGKRVRWEMEKTFEIRRRLATWFSRIKEFSGLKETKGVVI